MFWIMLVTVVFCVFVGMYCIKNDPDPENIPSLSLFGVFYIFIAVGGILGIFAKTFQWWGNSW